MEVIIQFQLAWWAWAKLQEVDQSFLPVPPSFQLYRTLKHQVPSSLSSPKKTTIIFSSPLQPPIPLTSISAVILVW